MKHGLIVFLLFLCPFLFGQKTGSRLQQEIDRLKNDPVMKHGSLAICVMTADSGKLVAELNSALCMTPASTMKILTAGAALGILGENYRYTTTLEYEGQLDSVNGVLKGNLIIRGSGDPSLGSQFFGSDSKTGLADKWVNALRGKGIKKIEGAVIADTEIFEDNPVPQGWTWSDMGNYYGAGAYGLNWIDNRYRIYFDSGKEGDTVAIDRFEPEVYGLTLDNQVTSGGKKDDAFIYGAPYAYAQTVSGSIPPNRNDFDVDGALPDPPHFFARWFDGELKKSGITITGAPGTTRLLRRNREIQVKPEPRHFLASVQSLPLSEIVRHTLMKSDNMYTECLLKTVSLKSAKQGNTDDGIATVLGYWKSLGLDTEALFMKDGSGLSRSNAITTFQQASLLRIARQQTWFASFEAALPLAGVNGSMASLCKGTTAEKNMRAKTGYITRARGYAGFVKDKNGRVLCFSLLANNYNCSAAEMRKRLEKILVAMAEVQ